jgi:hypothetical protein
LDIWDVLGVEGAIYRCVETFFDSTSRANEVPARPDAYPAMKRCPNCDAHQEDDADYCPVCGETFPGPTMSVRTGPPWYAHTGYMLAFIVLLWPIALVGLYQRDSWDQNADQWMLAGCLGMAVVWTLLLRSL